MGDIFYKRNGTSVIVRKFILAIHPSDKWIRCGPSLLVSAPSPPTVPAGESVQLGFSDYEFFKENYRGVKSYSKTLL
jgi:hypothetical protein